MKTLNNALLPLIGFETVENIVTSYDYYQVIASLADDVINRINEVLTNNDLDFELEAIEDFVNESALNEEIDGSEYAIYNHYHLPIIMHSNNDDYYIDNFGSESGRVVLAEKGLSGLHSTLAFYCLYADVQEVIQTHLESVDFDIEEKEDE